MKIFKLILKKIAESERVKTIKRRARKRVKKFFRKHGGVICMLLLVVVYIFTTYIGLKTTFKYVSPRECMMLLGLI